MRRGYSLALSAYLQFEEGIAAANRIKASSFLIDGEAVIARDDGTYTYRTRQHLSNSENPVSRGYGKIQWRLLAILAAHERHPASRADRYGRGLDTPTLALRVHGREATYSEMVSIRRALAALMRAGEVRIVMTYERRHYWVRQVGRERSG